MEINSLTLSLGSNIPPREEYLKQAWRLLSERVGKISKHSQIYTTPPLGFDSENLFLNCCLQLETKLTPIELLKVTQEIEKELGRTSKSTNQNYSSRTIDIDIIFFNQEVIDNEKLTVPHPLYTNRMFVLKPLNDLATNLLDPISYLTVEQLLINCEDNSTLIIYENQFFDSL